ncbi:DUF11 domain-containing protein [Paenibacillus sp. L3-i20]|uniref:DUF11 domain-containing protein n=1 Tax=Paenibacillus sp. L3-i20 TaxID=2905833 RepID=UPI001EE13B27|nr:DUF11 domain-containing protein [Paenibacillus sp. L3-i20]GKU78793.1 hypothetical protein L3i20_v231900 [Paenibacillus sp. L3-i20]
MPASLNVAKLVNDTTAVSNQKLTYTNVIFNCGTDDALNVLFTDVTPVGTTYDTDSFVLNGVSLPAADPNVGVNIGTVPAGSFSTAIFQVTVDCLDTTTTITNQSTVTFDATSVNSNTVTTEALGANDSLEQIALEELNLASQINTQGTLIQTAIQNGVSIAELLEVNENAIEALEEITEAEAELVDQLDDILDCIGITP